MIATVIIPTYQERGNIERIIPAVLAQGDVFRVLVVDDNSPDGTADAASRLRKQFPDRLEVARREKKYGLGAAYVYGFAKALQDGSDRIFEMDADFSHSPDQLGELLEASEGADLVIGSRYVRGGGIENWPATRRWISRLGNWYARFLLGSPVRDMTAGFKCYRREVLEAIDVWSIRSTGYAFQVETTWRALKAGFRVQEVPITFVERAVGKSKMSRDIIKEAARVVWQLRVGRDR